MFVTLFNRIDQKQTTVAENKIFALTKYVPRNNSPDLPVARIIISQISIVQQYDCHSKKNEKQILVICLMEQHKNSGRKWRNLCSPDQYVYA